MDKFKEKTMKDYTAWDIDCKYNTKSNACQIGNFDGSISQNYSLATAPRQCGVCTR